uniref:uncharacterized protein LOC124004945 n=1 Tax=Oncorhynchus gorbuscha TaxID=8017 RepID=UPI001EAEE24D|nr:uncharacterized protein LOC124004945 [Oncorhynchus gorbuscha]
MGGNSAEPNHHEESTNPVEGQVDGPDWEKALSQLGHLVRNPDFEPRQCVSRNRNRRPQVTMTPTGVLQPIAKNRDPVEQSPRQPSPDRTTINCLPHTQTVPLCEEKEREKALLVKARERTMRYLKEDVAYYHEKVTKDLGSLGQTLDRALEVNKNEEEAKLEERIDFERMVRRFGKGERLMKPALEVAGRIDRKRSRHPKVKKVMNGRRAGQIVKVAEDEESEAGQNARPVKIDKETAAEFMHKVQNVFVGFEKVQDIDMCHMIRKQIKQDQMMLDAWKLQQELVVGSFRNYWRELEEGIEPMLDRVQEIAAVEVENDFATLESVSQNYRSPTPVTMTSLTSVSLTAPRTATTATAPLFLPVIIPPSSLQTTAAPPLPLPHRLPPLNVPLPTLAWPQTTHLPPISTQTEGGQTCNTDRTETPVLDSNGDLTGETNEIDVEVKEIIILPDEIDYVEVKEMIIMPNATDYEEVEEIIILPDEERFQVKQEKKEEVKVKEKKEQENETEEWKKCRKTLEKK